MTAVEAGLTFLILFNLALLLFLAHKTRELDEACQQIQREKATKSYVDSTDRWLTRLTRRVDILEAKDLARDIFPQEVARTTARHQHHLDLNVI